MHNLKNQSVNEENVVTIPASTAYQASLQMEQSYYRLNLVFNYCNKTKTTVLLPPS